MAHWEKVAKPEDMNSIPGVRRRESTPIS
ncbi:rCG23155 [Rattus norvegicus]|uniref:RCG23155 n=1 Tax=Rattus norvegicus TaxID=10116 RepID=A6KG74_RAT|nr:rCG23155 [Rattus norvegicus]